MWLQVSATQRVAKQLCTGTWDKVGIEIESSYLETLIAIWQSSFMSDESNNK